MGAAFSVGKKVVGRDELGTANGTFELLASSVLEAAAFFLLLLSALDALLVGTARGHLPACGR